jgi:hypothetical protein
MDIGPISAIRPVAMVKPSRGAPDLSRVFEVEYLGQSRDDQYSSANQKAARGLEDEEAEFLAEDPTEADPSAEPLVRSGNVNFSLTLRPNSRIL